jgi:ACS family hexuronate transporter-like MFS transporter
MPRPIRNLRYYVLALLFLSTLINYIDRQTLSVMSSDLGKRFGWDNEDYSRILMAFQIAYAVMQSGSGFLIDRLGTRAGFALTIVFWSLAAMAHSLARGVASFAACRFLLGLGEAGNWPGSAKATSEWFPSKDRAFATGLWNTGSATGAVLAPPLIYLLVSRFGWQSAFLVTGSLGFVWLGLWLWIYHPPARHPRVTQEELALLARDADSSGGAAETVRWRDLWRRREVWGLTLARFVSDPVWWFYLFWLPRYLGDQRGFDLMQIGLTAWIPYLSADVGSVAGGFASSWLIRRGVPLLRARKIVIVASASLMLAAPLAVWVQSPAAMLAFISLATFAHQSWASGILTLPADLFRGPVVGSCMGLTGTGAGLGGILATFLIGKVVQHQGYAPVFVWAGLMHPLSAIIVLALVRPRASEVAA